MAEKLSIATNQDGKTLNVRFEGIIDEDADFSGINAKDCETLHFDFDSCTGINSCGIREWISFIDSVDAAKKIHYMKCNKFIIEQINMVSGFFKEGSSVDSFYAPYFCEECDDEKKVLLKIEQVKDKCAPEIKCETCGQVMEFDAIEEQYFQFIP